MAEVPLAELEATIRVCEKYLSADDELASWTARVALREVHREDPGRLWSEAATSRVDCVRCR